MTGQTAGLAVLLSYATGWPFGALLLVVNLPFYWLGWRRRGPAFTAKTVAAVWLVALLTSLMPGWVAFERLDPLFGAVLVGFLSAAALLALFRHGILALVIQERTGFRAGYTQLLFDAALFTGALLVLDLRTVAISALGAVVLNLVIAINHRRDRYVAA